MDDNEKRVFDEYQKQLIELKKERLNSYKNTISEFRKHCRRIGIELGEGAFDYSPKIGVIAHHPNILLALEQGLAPDKAGLFECALLKKLFKKQRSNPGYYFSNNYMAMAHPMFRRGMYEENNWAPRFIDLFWGLDDKKEVSSYISLDRNRVRVNVDDSCYVELDTWFGAPFNEDIARIEDGTVKLRPSLDIKPRHVSLLFNSTYSLDIHWKTKESIKSFQALEFKENDIKINHDGNEYYPARYLHAEYDLNTACFRHFDGAIQYYSEQEYYQRRDTDFRHNEKLPNKIKAHSQKSFKFNGSIDTDMWQEFFSHFMTGNPLVHEYLTGSYPDYLTEHLAVLCK